MGIKAKIEKLKSSRLVEILRGVLSSKYFPFITAVIVVGCYYLSWDLITFWYIGLCGIAMLLLLDDVTPIISLFLFMSIMVSWKNSPSIVAGNSDYVFQPAVLSQIIVIITLFVSVILFRIVLSIKKRQFKLTPTFWGLCLLALSMLLNGAFSDRYVAMDVVYGLFLAFFFLAIFVFGSGNISVNKKTYEKIAWGFIALSLALVIELVVAYATYEGLIVDGCVDRDKLMFGWGVYNTMGMLITISLPSAAYLAITKKHGWIFTSYLILLTFCDFLTLSRQAILCGAVVCFVCIIAIFIKGKNDLAHGGMIIFWIVVSVFITKQFNGAINQTLASLMSNFSTGSGRVNIYKMGYEYFLNSPVFGVGFYVPVEGDYGASGMDLIPRMFHNTVIQLLATGGVFAFAAYVIHRTHTVISYVKNPTMERTYVAMTIASLLMLNLLDNHLFYMVPTMIYSMLVSVLINSEKVKKVEQST